MSSPYATLPDTAFWRSGVQAADPGHMHDLFRPKFAIGPDDRITTAGSCFAQHITHHLRGCGLKVSDMEPAPPGMATEDARRFGYGLYSARYGNIYTARQLLQLVEAASGRFVAEDVVWEKDGRFYDALRPGVEPEGLDSAEEVLAHRAHHLDMVRRLIRSTDVFIFTLGLTEAWAHTASGTVYPTAPGTLAGDYDPARYGLCRFSVTDVVRDMTAVLNRLRRGNPGLRVILTVSPVPLTATATDQHVLRATVHAKAVLHVAAETLAEGSDDVDYFPSYEIVTNPAAKMQFFEPNLRSVRPEGVAAVMGVFLGAFGLARSEAAAVVETPEAEEGDDGVVCEEMLLDAFAGRGT